MKFTFKKEKKETGLAGVGYPYANTQIKESKLRVGYIYAPNWRTKDNLWGIGLAIKKEPTKEKPAPFKWIRIQYKFNEEVEAREWIKENLANLINSSKIELYHFED